MTPAGPPTPRESRAKEILAGFLDDHPRFKRLYFAWVVREWPWKVPKEAELIGLRRPPEHVFKYFRRVNGYPEDLP